MRTMRAVVPAVLLLLALAVAPPAFAADATGFENKESG